MINVFSYCIYGSNPKYVEGMIKNLEQICMYYPGFQTWIVVGNDVPPEYIEKYKSFPNVTLTHCPFSGGRLMTYRFFPIDNPSVHCMIVRDADSRIGERDRECIRRFLESNFTLFTIRDHYYHKCPIMAGQWGIKRTVTDSEFGFEAAYNEIKDELTKNCGVDAYDTDQFFTRHYIYPKYGSRMIAFTSVNYDFSKIETVADISLPRIDDTDFCGNVFEFRRRDDGSLEEYPFFKYQV
jgi:hypothetical protein